MQPVPLSQMTVHKNRLLVAALAAAGASLIAVNPMNPSAELPDVAHQAVKLMAGEEPWSQVVAAAEINLSDAADQCRDREHRTLDSSGNLSGEFSGQISTALTGFETGVAERNRRRLLRR